MGVLNVTPDSFSDGGCYSALDAAISRGRQMIAEGADVVDVGGESSRPGASSVPESEELRRVLPVIQALSGEVRVSVDTAKASVADAALVAGATVLNDITGTLWPVAARRGAAWVAMHMQGQPADMQRGPRYEDVVGEVFGFVLDRARTAAAAGVGEIWVDPGIGFGKTLQHNLVLLAHLDELSGAAKAEGFGTLIGTSRKSFLGSLAGSPGAPLAPGDRLEGSLATALWAVTRGVGMVRAHDVGATVQAMTLAPEVAA